jgi:tRNA A37 threonylcarbamoyladenosine dehydratase
MLERMKLLVNDDVINKLKEIRVLIVGIGGVGGACFEALVRLGVTNITVVDNDKFSKSNLNRQLLSNINNIGNLKVNEAVLRAKSINPDIIVKTYEMFLNEANINEINIRQFDYVFDCCDTVTTKYILIKKCIDYGVKIISSMGTGNRLDPTKIVIKDIWKTNNDPLAKAMRKILRDNDIKTKIPVVTSDELPIKTGVREVGSVVFVPNVAGFCMASWLFSDIMDK